MGKKNAKNNKKKAGTGNASAANGGGLMVDPARVRFQHARIRPYFSGCGRSVLETLEEIRQGKMSPSDLPPIQVIVGPSTEHDGPWYFSLNNRRLWVLKRCRDEGLLPNNEIYVRVRKPKSDQEAERYSLQNCALEAKIIPEKQKAKAQQDSTMKEVVGDATNGAVNDVVKGVIALKEEENPDNEDATSSSDEHSESSDDLAGPSNRFSALLL